MSKELKFKDKETGEIVKAAPHCDFKTSTVLFWIVELNDEDAIFETDEFSTRFDSIEESNE